MAMIQRYEKFCRLTNGHGRGITAVAFSGEGNFVATGGLDGKVCVWRLGDAKLLYSFSGENAILTLTWLPGREDALICGSQGGNVIVLTINVDERAIEAKGFWAHKYPVECLALADDRLATGAHRELTVWKWNESSRRFHRVRNLPEPPSSSNNQHQEVLATSVHWTPVSATSPSMLLVSYMFHGIHLFEAKSWGRVRTIPLQCQIADTSLSPDGAYIAVSNMQKGVDIYEMASELLYRSFEHEVGEPYPTPVLFVHNGHAVVGGSTVGKVDAWDAHGMGKMRCLPIPKRAKVLALAAHHRRVGDGVPPRYEFYIATGIMNENSTSYCIVWKGESLSLPSDLPQPERSSWLMALMWTAISAILLAYLATLTPASNVH